MWVRIDLRRRARALAVLALLVALSSGVVFAAIAGARRNGTAVDRLAQRSLTADAWALANVAGMDWNKVRRLPYVEAVAEFAVAQYDVRGYDGLGFLPPASRELATTVERGVVVEGRRADPDRMDEIMASPGAKKIGIHVGTRLSIGGWRADKLAQYMQMPGTPPADGPHVDATVVGIMKSPFFSGDGEPGILPSWRFYQTYKANIPSFTNSINALVRLRGGDADFSKFAKDVDRIAGRPVEVIRAKDQVATARKATNLERNALFAFAFAAGVAALVLVGQAVIRLVASSAADGPVLGAMGLTTRQRSLALAIPPLLAGALGGLIGVAFALAASGLFPIATARQIEPSPGLNANWAILGVGLVVVLVLVVIGVLLSAFWDVRRGERDRVARQSRVARVIRETGAPLPLALGAQLALERGRGRSAVPVLPALIGAIVGVLGVVGTLTFRAGLDHATNDIRLFGQQFQAVASFAPDDKVDPAFVQSLVSDQNVQTVNENPIAVVSVNGRAVTVFAAHALKGTTRIVTLSGRAPRAPDEITLAPSEASALHVRTGDTVRVGAAGVPHRLVGIGFTPVDSHTTYDQGAWMTLEGQRAVTPAKDGYKYVRYDVEFGRRVDVKAEAEKLGKNAPTTLDLVTPPANSHNLKGVRRVPVALGVFLALLAIAAVGHALASAVRRRRRDIAVMRSIGFTRRQARLTVVWQATTLALVGLAFGVPMGLLAGRAMWHNVATSTPVVYVPPLEVVVLVIVVPAALLIANALAAWPARRAARLRAAEVLRAE
jgi:ABC-type lipoprotein release transport system permease subunit